MKILAIEASAKTAGACVMSEGRVLAEYNINNGLTHSQTLMPMVAQVMEASGLKGEDLDVVAFTNGPGSFTGLRIGAATAKGLAMGWNKPVLPLPTLEAMACGAVEFEGLVVPVMDARRHQVYTAVYRSVGGGLTEVLSARAIAAKDLVSFLEEQKEKVLVLGDQEAVGPFEGRMDAPAHMREMRAASLCWIAERKLDSGVSPVPSDQVTVEYLRRPQAERERLEKEAAHGK